MQDLRETLQSTLGGSYRFERELGGGGMSRVFLAEDLALGRRVVVKVVHPELAAGVSGERFRREIQVAAQLQHPHIVPVLAAGDVAGLPFYTMPYVAGQALRSRLTDGHGLPIDEVVSVLRDVAKALAYAHAAGVVHRDIKPDNVLLSAGSAAVTDFGIAKAISVSRTQAASPSATSSLTAIGTSLGTPTYMAPEQAAGDPAADHRVDIYAFGAMAYELIAGKPPFHDRPVHQLFAAHMTEAPPALGGARADAPPRLAELVMQCLEKDPARRPQTADAIVRALESGSVTAPQPAASPFDRAVRGRRVATAAVATVAALSAAILGARQLSTPNVAPDESVIAVLPFRVVTPDPGLQYLHEGMVDLLAVKLNGEGGPRAADPRTAIAAWRDATDNDTRILTPSQGAAVARRIGATKLLWGEVVSTPPSVMIRANVYAVRDAKPLADASVQGSPDSLAALVDQLTLKMLAALSPDARQQRVASLTTTSLPALRAYLDGQAKLRQANGQDAARDFARAIAADSSFALAGLGLHIASAWFGNQHDREAGLRVAWRSREQLGPRDRALLDALAGPRYPESSSTIEHFEAARRYLELAPDRADAWMVVGDQLYHYGGVVGVPNYREESLRHFKRASELDSGYVLFTGHAIPLAVTLGDTAFARLAHERRRATDTTAYSEREYRWILANARGDSATVRAMRDSIPQYPEPAYGTFVRHAFNGITTSLDAQLVVDHAQRVPLPEHLRPQIAELGYFVALARGRPTDAQPHLERRYGPTQNAWVLMVRDYMMGEGDSAVATRGAAELERLARGSFAPDSAGREAERTLLRALEAWRIANGDTARTSGTIDRLRTILRLNGRERDVEARTEIAVLEAMLADVRGSGRAEAAHRLDSLLRATDYNAVHEGRVAFANLVVSRLFEATGDQRRALAAVRRRREWMDATVDYLGAMLRHEGRLAAATGDVQGAVRAYRHYLSLRTDPEPAIRPEVERVRRELAALEGRER